MIMPWLGTGRQAAALLPGEWIGDPRDRSRRIVTEEFVVGLIAGRNCGGMRGVYRAAMSLRIGRPACRCCILQARVFVEYCKLPRVGHLGLEPPSLQAGLCLMNGDIAAFAGDS